MFNNRAPRHVCLRGPRINNCPWKCASCPLPPLAAGVGTLTSSFFLRFASSLAGSGMGMSSGALSDARSPQLKPAWQKPHWGYLAFQGGRQRKREAGAAPSARPAAPRSSGGRIWRPAPPPV